MLLKVDVVTYEYAVYSSVSYVTNETIHYMN